ncbi:MAG: hypothetical protein QOE97_3211 [Pseudonocardiales bacterium]|jgi:hypothetical protein|nr:hypothetical protein [Pseudonocardiales bacterium]
MTPGRITVYRTGSWRDGAQPYRIWVDGTLIGRLYPDGSIGIDVAPGPHVIRAAAPLYSGCRETIPVRERERRWLVVRPAGGVGFDRLIRPLGRLAVLAA